MGCPLSCHIIGLDIRSVLNERTKFWLHYFENLKCNLVRLHSYLRLSGYFTPSLKFARLTTGLLNHLYQAPGDQTQISGRNSFIIRMLLALLEEIVHLHSISPSTYFFDCDTFLTTRIDKVNVRTRGSV